MYGRNKLPGIGGGAPIGRWENNDSKIDPNGFKEWPDMAPAECGEGGV